MHLGLTKSRDDKLLQDLLDKKLRVIVVFEDDYLNHIARIAYKDIQQDNYTYRIGEYNIYKGEEWGFCDFCKRHDCYFIVPNETIEGSSSEISNDLEEAAKEYAKTLFTRPYSDTPEEVITIIEPEKFAGFIAGAKWQKEQMMKEAVEGWVAADSDTDGKRRVTFFPQKPVRDALTEYKYWAATYPRYESIKLDSNAFPNLKWEDEPKKVKFIIEEG